MFITRMTKFLYERLREVIGSPLSLHGNFMLHMVVFVQVMANPCRLVWLVNLSFCAGFRHKYLLLARVLRVLKFLIGVWGCKQEFLFNKNDCEATTPSLYNRHVVRQVILDG